MDRALISWNETQKDLQEIHNFLGYHQKHCQLGLKDSKYKKERGLWTLKFYKHEAGQENYLDVSTCYL